MPVWLVSEVILVYFVAKFALTSECGRRNPYVSSDGGQT